MTYNELQIKAAELGMGKTVGKTTKELEAFIASKENADNPPQSPTPTDTPTQSNEDKGSPSVGGQPQTPEYTLATVLDANREVRQYDLETHGVRFAELAQEFSTARKYRVVMGFLKGKISCPSCGHKFNQ